MRSIRKILFGIAVILCGIAFSTENLITWGMGWGGLLIAFFALLDKIDDPRK